MKNINVRNLFVLIFVFAMSSLAFSKAQAHPDDDIPELPWGDKDSLTINLTSGDIWVPGEYVMQQPGLCTQEDVGQAEIKVRWNKNSDKVTVHGKFHTLEPNPSVTWQFDPSRPAPFARYTEGGITNGDYYMVMFVRFFDEVKQFAWDSSTGDLICMVEDATCNANIPVDAILDYRPVGRALWFGPMQPNPDGKINEKFHISYSQMLDSTGGSGMIATQVEGKYNDFSTINLYYNGNNAGVPDGAASFDDFINLINNGGTSFFNLAVLPNPVPDFMQLRYGNVNVATAVLNGEPFGYPFPQLCPCGQEFQVPFDWPNTQAVCIP